MEKKRDWQKDEAKQLANVCLFICYLKVVKCMHCFIVVLTNTLIFFIE